jgi:hypothetical protein
MHRGQIPMFARETIYTPYFYLQKRNHVGSINEFASKTRLSLIDRYISSDILHNISHCTYDTRYSIIVCNMFASF